VILKISLELKITVLRIIDKNYQGYGWNNYTNYINYSLTFNVLQKNLAETMLKHFSKKSQKDEIKW